MKYIVNNSNDPANNIALEAYAFKELTDIDCAKVLIAVKLVRESYKHKEDNLIDACGYLKLLNDLYECTNSQRT